MSAEVVLARPSASLESLFAEPEQEVHVYWRVTVAGAPGEGVRGELNPWRSCRTSPCRVCSLYHTLGLEFEYEACPELRYQQRLGKKCTVEFLVQIVSCQTTIQLTTADEIDWVFAHARTPNGKKPTPSTRLKTAMKQ